LISAAASCVDAGASSLVVAIEDGELATGQKVSSSKADIPDFTPA
jgi:hypothetical protein